jgi:hypothetical protein
LKGLSNNNLTRPESNDDSVEGVVVTDAFVNWLLDPVCDRTDSVGRLNAEDIPKLLQEFNAKDNQQVPLSDSSVG